MLPGKYIKRGSQNNVQCRMPVEHGLYGSFLNHRNFKVIKDVYFYLEIAKKKKKKYTKSFTILLEIIYVMSIYTQLINAIFFKPTQ